VRHARVSNGSCLAIGHGERQLCLITTRARERVEFLGYDRGRDGILRRGGA
jgi:hypothetical protein